MRVRDLLIGVSADRRWLVGIGMRNCAQLGNEQRQRNQGCDAKIQAMRPIEQSHPHGWWMLAPSVQSGNSGELQPHAEPRWQPLEGGPRCATGSTIFSFSSIVCRIRGPVRAQKCNHARENMRGE